MDTKFEKFIDMDSHEQTRVLITRDNQSFEIEVDIFIADLISKLNSKGFFTKYSCSSHEEEAFATFYISFASLDAEPLKQLNDMIKRVPDIYSEVNYEISADVSHGSSFIILVDPSQDDIMDARKIVSRVSKCDDVSKFESNHIVVRTILTKELIELPSYEDDDGFELNKYVSSHCDKNKEIVLNTIKQWIDILDDYEDIISE